MHIQACAFRDSYEKFKKAGAEVVGISGDDSSSHKVIISNKTFFYSENICLVGTLLIISSWIILSYKVEFTCD